MEFHHIVLLTTFNFQKQLQMCAANGSDFPLQPFEQRHETTQGGAWIPKNDR
jgi:hypothetical protein